MFYLSKTIEIKWTKNLDVTSRGLRITTLGSCEVLDDQVTVGCARIFLGFHQSLLEAGHGADDNAGGSSGWYVSSCRSRTKGRG